MATKQNITFEFLVALPGSGKTTLAKGLGEKNRSKTEVVDFDATFELCEWRRANEQDKARIIRNTISNHLRNPRTETLILDGLFLTHDDIMRVIMATHQLFKHVDIVVHQWNEDRETCIKNDGGRREVSSTNTILNAEFEQINDMKLMEILKDGGYENVKLSKIQYHTVQLKPDWDRYFRGKADVWHDGKIRSKKWCTGGSYGSCWHNELSPVTPDDQPEFDELDELLNEICPTITFLQYKKIMSNCVELEEYYESDYYGGGCTYKRYVCDIKKLYNMLQEFGYIV